VKPIVNHDSFLKANFPCVNSSGPIGNRRGAGPHGDDGILGHVCSH
jgi:hypothetical protein